MMSYYKEYFPFDAGITHKFFINKLLNYTSSREQYLKQSIIDIMRPSIFSYPTMLFVSYDAFCMQSYDNCNYPTEPLLLWKKLISPTLSNASGMKLGKARAILNPRAQASPTA